MKDIEKMEAQESEVVRYVPVEKLCVGAKLTHRRGKNAQVTILDPMKEVEGMTGTEKDKMLKKIEEYKKDPYVVYVEDTMPGESGKPAQVYRGWMNAKAFIEIETK